jgi:hypothetical protein
MRNFINCTLCQVLSEFLNEAGCDGGARSKHRRDE